MTAAAGAALATVLVVAALRGAGAYPPLGLADPGVLVRLATPALRLVADLAGAACLGGFALALVLSTPAADGSTGVTVVGRRALVGASTAAGVWAVAAFASAFVVLADSTGGQLLPGPDVVVRMLARAEPVGWLATGAIAVGVAVWAREVRTWSSGAAAAVLATAGLLGPVVTGHSVDGVNHDLGLPASAVHVVALALWLGALAAVLVAGHDARVRHRSGRLSAGCAVVVVASGLVDAAVLVPTPGELATEYGVLLLLAVALGVPAVAAVARRRLAGWTPRLVTVELVSLALVVAVSATMARTVPPVQYPGHASVPEAVLGFALPDPPTAWTLLTSWRLEPVSAAVAVLLALGYTVGLRRLARHARGQGSPGRAAQDQAAQDQVSRWPVGRSTAWFAGCAVLVVATSSGLGRYGPAVFSAHVAGHMLIATVVPALLVLGGPVTLARRTLRRAAPDGPEGPAEWLEHVLDAPALRLATHPLVIVVVVVGSPFLLYLTPLFALTQPVGWVQPVMNAWFLGAGVLFAWILIGVDPAPRRLPHVARLTVLLASMPFHAVFGVILLTADRPVSFGPALVADGGGGTIGFSDFYARLNLWWAPDALADQRLAAALSWAMGDLPLLAMVVVLLVQWSRAAAAEDAAAREGLLAELSGRR